MKLTRYLALVRVGIIDRMQFRLGIFVSFFGNITYLVIIYFLWKAIFSSSGREVVNGMTFSDTMVYLVLAMSLFSFMEVFMVWDMGRSIQSGRIILDILKPVGYQPFMFFNTAGNLVVSFFMALLPTTVIVYFLSGRAITFGVNLLFFLIGICFGVIINFGINFMVGTICLYTESTWGINIMKEVIVLLLSGATIPLAFFPDTLRTVVGYLPFQAIYNVPLQLLINKELSFWDSTEMILLQVFWTVVMILASQMFWKFSLRRITINGG